MKAAASIIRAPLKLLGLIPKKPPNPVAQAGPVTRDDTRARAEREDELRRRRGSAADIVTGTAGAEAPAAASGAATLG